MIFFFLAILLVFIQFLVRTGSGTGLNWQEPVQPVLIGSGSRFSKLQVRTGLNRTSATLGILPSIRLLQLLLGEYSLPNCNKWWSVSCYIYQIILEQCIVSGNYHIIISISGEIIVVTPLISGTCPRSRTLHAIKDGVRSNALVFSKQRKN